MENVNIKNMLAELKREFPDNWGDGENGLNLIIKDQEEFVFSEESAFSERILYYIEIQYKGDGTRIDISDYSDYSTFDIREILWIDAENLEVIGKVISIVAKHLKNIDFYKHYRVG